MSAHTPFPELTRTENGFPRKVTADGRIRGAEDVVRLTAVPNRAWANRRPGPMWVWIPEV
ncbi:hypothetical protein [Streptomyces mirabilis]|uniref:hypothetical protein n=1 Tax=Streptomyces mirabilis TaxID=68239 RepID=UPI003437EDF3